MGQRVPGRRTRGARRRPGERERRERGAHQRRPQLEKRRGLQPQRGTVYDLTRHDPDYSRITWGALGKQVNQFQMAPVWALIGDGQYDKAIARIGKFRRADALDLQMRVQNMITVTHKLNESLDQLNKLR